MMERKYSSGESKIVNTRVGREAGVLVKITPLRFNNRAYLRLRLNQNSRE